MSSPCTKIGLFITLSLLLLPTTPLAADRYRIAVFDNAAPVVDLDDENKPMGFFPALLETLCKDLDHEVDFIPYSTFSEAYTAVAAGEADILPALQYSEERAREFDINHVPFMITWSQIYTASARDEFESLLDLRGARIGVMEGDRNGESFLSLADSFDLQVEVEYYPTFTQIGEALESGEVDAGVFFNTYFRAARSLHATDIVFNPTEAYIGLTKGRDPEFIEAIDARLRELKRNQSSYYHTIMRRYLVAGEGAGVPRWVYPLLAAALFILGATLLFMLLLQRTIHRIRLDLTENEIRYRAIFQKTGSLMLLVDAESGRIRDANEAAVRFYGYPAGTLQSFLLTDLEPTDTSSTESFVKTATDAEALRFHREHRLADGEHRYMQIDAGTVIVQGERLLIMVLHDETEKVEAGRRLNDERRRAEEALAVKNDFLANISHELRTPLNGIIGMLSLLDNLALDAEERYFLTMAQDSADLLYEIIRDILDFNLLETSRLAIESQVFDLRQALEMGSALFRGNAEEKGIKIRLDLSLEPVWYRGDRGRLLQILGNLLSNAIKYSERGAILIEARRRGGLELSVHDEGIGIAADKLDSIFNAFHQLEDPYTKKVRGTGLGLTIVRELTELMGGEIEVESQPGRGSRFTVRLPDAFTDTPPHAAGGGESGAGLPESFEGRRILIVEDEAVNRLYLSQLLKENGFRVYEAGDGDAAISACVEIDPDLILMDVGLPKRNGIDAAETILSFERFKDLPIIALTAHAHARDRERFLAAGMVDVVTKPFREDQLIAAVRGRMRAEEDGKQPSG